MAYIRPKKVTVYNLVMNPFSKEIIADIAREVRSCIPQLSINCVIFKFDGQTLQIPIVQFTNTDIWTIPGGYIRQSEDISTAAKRILFEQTQLKDLLLSQFGTFGAAGRSFEDEMSGFSKLGIPMDLMEWISQRFVTIGYYSIVRNDTIKLEPGPMFNEVKWVSIKEADQLALDHSQLVDRAWSTLRQELLSKPLLLSFMPETFSIPELQKLYEVILDRPVDRGNFRQRMLKSKILTKIGQSTIKTGSRPPIIYKLDKERYLDSLTSDIKLGF